MKAEGDTIHWAKEDFEHGEELLKAMDTQSRGTTITEALDYDVLCIIKAIESHCPLGLASVWQLGTTVAFACKIIAGQRATSVPPAVAKDFGNLL